MELSLSQIIGHGPLLLWQGPSHPHLKVLSEAVGSLYLLLHAEQPSFFMGVNAN